MSGADNPRSVSEGSITLLAPSLSHKHWDNNPNAVPSVISRMSSIPQRWSEVAVQLRAELRTLFNLRTFNSKGPRRYGIGIATSDVMLGDRIWELEHILYMGVIRWALGEHGRSGEYHMVGKVLLFNLDDTLVTPELRKGQDNSGAPIFKEDRTLIPKLQRTFQPIRDEVILLNLDTINLQRMTC